MEREKRYVIITDTLGYLLLNKVWPRALSPTHLNTALGKVKHLYLS